MEANKAKLLLQVDDLQASLEFYITRLGWKRVDAEAIGQAVMLSATGASDYLVVLTELAANEPQDNQKMDLTSWLLSQAHRAQRGDHIYIGVSSTLEVEQDLRNRGFNKLRQEEDAGSIRKLYVSTPDGHTIIYWEELFPADEEIIAIYAAGADELDQVLRGLSEAELEQTEAPGKWSIRQQVLHMIDLELVAIHKVKFALAEPGRAYEGNGFSQDDWSAALVYASRPIEPELAMFRAVRQHILGLCKHLPDALQCTVVTSNREESVAKLLKMMSGHAGHHMRAIARIRATLSKNARSK